jgi:murein DD-endopeptidase MepM/ murein hydrolase activator NlpD
VKTGEYVERGHRIGGVGQSGRVTGPHLHWVTRYGGVTVDPMSVLALLGAE